MKKCSKCFTDKPHYEFHKHSATKDRLDVWCKQCRKSYDQERRQRPEVRAADIWEGIQRRCLNRDGKHNSYSSVRCLFTKDEFISWCSAAITAFLAQHPGEVPSIHRTSDRGDYAPGNVKIISWSLNQKLARKNGHQMREVRDSQPRIKKTGDPVIDFYRANGGL